MDKLSFVKVNDNNLIDLTSEMANEIWNEYYDRMLSREQVGYMVNEFQSAQAITRQIDEGMEYYLVGRKGEYVGYIAFMEDEGLYISKYYLYKKMRGKGFGRQTMEFIESLANKKGLQRIWLKCNRGNTDAIKVYKRLGFDIVGESSGDLGKGYVATDFILEKFLQPA